MTKDDANGRLAENALDSIALAYQVEGMQKLYDSAALRGDTVTADNLRQQLHDLLDRKLDLRSVNMLLIRALANAKG